jgi:hypothetical protein
VNTRITSNVLKSAVSTRKDARRRAYAVGKRLETFSHSAESQSKTFNSFLSATDSLCFTS